MTVSDLIYLLSQLPSNTKVKGVILPKPIAKLDYNKETKTVLIR